MMNIQLKELAPDYYNNVLEMNELLRVEQELTDETQEILNQFQLNQYIITCNSEALGWYEYMYNVPINTGDSIEVRKQRLLTRLNTRPPFTWLFLLGKLDNLYGKDKYIAEMDSQNFTVTVECGASNYYLFRETTVLMANVLPCNMRYIQVPRVTEQILLKENLLRQEVAFARVGSCVIGKTPLVYEDKDKEVVIE